MDVSVVVGSVVVRSLGGVALVSGSISGPLLVPLVARADSSGEC